MSNDLIKRLEEEGPSRELDEAIGLLAGWERAHHPKYMWQKPNGMYSTVGLPEFTSSIDAALTLVSHWAIIAQRHLLARVMQRIHDGNLEPAKHMARLICIEALPDLRAREEVEG